jgi:predicted metal-dependent enzyme (double-stranded beta helix superfamily)
VSPSSTLAPSASARPAWRPFLGGGRGRFGPPTALDALVTAVAAAFVAHQDEAERAAAVADALRPALGDPDLLDASLCRSYPDRYRANVAYVAPDGSFSVVALVWRQGQRTAIHSHRSWCVVGVHQGIEREHAYVVDPVVPDGIAVRAAGAVDFHAGDVTWLVSGDDGVHAVENVGDDLAISLHVYGLDYRAAASSILRVFSEPPEEPEALDRAG